MFGKVFKIMKKFKFKNFFKEFSKNKITFLMSVLLSLVLWVLTTMFNSDSYSIVKISNVPIVSNLSNTQADQLGLSVVNITPKYVSVYIKGPRHKISFINKEDIIVNPKTYNNILYSGSYNLELSASLKKPQQDVSIESISRGNAVFVFDVLETKLINLVSDDISIKVDDGYIKDENICQPSSLSVSGPKQSIDQLKTIKLTVNKGEYNLNSTKIFDAVPQFISSDGSVMDSSVFKYNEDVKFNVTVPIYKLKKLPIKILYKNAPQSLNLNIFKPVIDPPFIEVGGTEEIIKNINEINLGYIDLRDLTDERSKFNFNLNLNSGLKNLKQVNSATVSFDNSNMYHKFFNIKGVELINTPENYDIFVNSKMIKDVKIVGFKEHLKRLNILDLTATVDCSEVDIKKGMQTVPVNIGIIKKDGVWPVGEYKCSISVRKK